MIARLLLVRRNFLPMRSLGKGSRHCYSGEVNFFAHSVIATEHCEHPAFVLGSMLPDFASMCGLRILALNDPELGAGVELHLRSDEAFHGAPRFVALTASSGKELEELGLSAGSATAVSHVGIELLLDGWLVEMGHSTAPYRSALADADRLTPAIVWAEADRSGRWPRLCQRLRESQVPKGYRQPDFVTTRLQQVLARYPKLALDEAAVQIVGRWIRCMKPRLGREAKALMGQVRTRLRELTGA